MRPAPAVKNFRRQPQTRKETARNNGVSWARPTSVELAARSRPIQLSDQRFKRKKTGHWPVL